MSMSCLASLGEDVLVDIVAFLEPPDLLRLAQTCKSLHQLTSVRLVWVHASQTHVIARGFPFPDVQLDAIPTSELIALTTRTYALGKRWCPGLTGPRRVRSIARTSGTSVSDVRFVPGHGGTLLAMLAKSVWSVLSVWDIADGVHSQKVCEWSPRGAVFTGFALNSDGRSEAMIAVSLMLDENHSVRILSLDHTDGVGYSLTELYSVDTSMVPVTLAGDLLALSNVRNQTVIWNWKDGTHALLEHTIYDPTIHQINECIQVLFAHESIFVARARSIHLFRFPALITISTSPPTAHHPIAQHSFGWIDSECMTICPFLDSVVPQDCEQAHAPVPPISILIRGEIDDPWASTTHNLELYTLNPNPAFFLRDEDPDADAPAPYCFPPRLAHTVASQRGALRCKKVALGRLGTALWVQPRDRFAGGLLADAQHQLAALPGRSARCETLVAAVFPGSLSRRDGKDGGAGSDGARAVVGTVIYENQAGSSWSAFDYDEVGGRVALGSSFGPVQVLYL